MATKFHLLAEQLLAVHSCWKRESWFSLSMKPRVGLSCSWGRSHIQYHTYRQHQLHLMGFFKWRTRNWVSREEMDLGGVWGEGKYNQNTVCKILKEIINNNNNRKKEPKEKN